ncbi:MAG: FeoB-associated Cys-rich membrane protein [Ruminococcaceae bacterium]|nr:FeoB-associated Cys-rich membrane protein [Oscillospiraceae bacterium]
MENLIVILILVCIVGLALRYIYKSKKQGAKCIGCPYAKECSKKSCGEDS